MFACQVQIILPLDELKSILCVAYNPKSAYDSLYHWTLHSDEEDSLQQGNKGRKVQSLKFWRKKKSDLITIIPLIQVYCAVQL